MVRFFWRARRRSPSWRLRRWRPRPRQKQRRRPIRAFLSLRGKVKRKRFHSFVENALDLAVQFYFSERMLDYNDAYAYFRGLVRKENERRSKTGEEQLKAPARFETLRRRITKAINHVTWTSKYSKREADQKFNGVADSLKAADMLAARGLSATVADARFAKPLDRDLVLRLAREHEALITVEEGSMGGFGAFVLQLLAAEGALDRGLKVRTLALPDIFQDHDKPELQYAEAGLDADGIVRGALSALGLDNVAARGRRA